MDRFVKMGTLFHRQVGIVFRCATKQALAEAFEIGRRHKRIKRIYSGRILRWRDLRRRGDARRTRLWRINRNYAGLDGERGVQHQDGFTRARKEYWPRQR